MIERDRMAEKDNERLYEVRGIADISKCSFATYQKKSFKLKANYLFLSKDIPLDYVHLTYERYTELLY